MSEVLDLREVKIDPAVALALPAQLAKRRRVLPFARLEGRVAAACVDPGDPSVLRAIQRYYEEPVQLHRADKASLEDALARTYTGAPTTSRLRKSAGAGRLRRGAPEPKAEEGAADDAVALCEELLHAAVLRRASDLHIDPEREDVRVRMRVDGVLEDYARLPSGALPGLLSRFKVLAKMDIAEKRAPQDGRFSYLYGGEHHVELRAASLPTKYGERLTLRLLALDTSGLTLSKLGLDEEQRGRVDRVLGRPHGLFLVTGPTGSGKSTTLYAGLRRLISLRPLNVITVEDPIEFDIDGVAQVEVDAMDKVGFGKALRSILRHDPDVIMIGEIRDGDSADVAIKAALTGHLVLSTLHTNTAPGAITRLVDMGVERYLVAATLRLAVAQRLVRRLCPHCRQPRALSPSEAETLGAPAAAGLEVYEPAGCLRCAGRGFSGRIGLFELLEVERPWAARINAGADETALINAMHEAGIPTLTEAALRRLREGQTSFTEAATAVTAW